MPEPNPAASLPFDFCTLKGRTDVRPVLQHATLAQLANHLQSHVRLVSLTRDDYLRLTKKEQAEAKDGPAVVLARFKPQSARTDEGVEVTTGIGLDVDERHVEFDVLRTILKGYAAIVYESLNSMSEARRWRVLLPFAVPATPDEHAAAFEYWSSKIPGIGPQSKNVSRLWYGVTQFAKARKRIFEVLDGKAFDVRTIPRPADAAAASKAAFKRAITPPANAPAAEGARNDQLSRYARSVVGMHQTFDTFLVMLQAMNATYLPPMDDDEVLQVARAKWKKFGPKVLPTGIPTIEEERFDDLFSTSADILGRQYASRIEYVENLLQVGATLKHGPSKKGKSWFLLDMADHVAHGKPTFLGRTVRQAKVLMIGAEDTALRFKERLNLMGIHPSNQLLLMHREQLKTWGERFAWRDDAGNLLPWTPESVISSLHAQTDAKVIIFDTQEVVEMTLAIEHGDRHVQLTRKHYLSTSAYDDIAQRLGIAVVLTAHWGAIKSVQMAATNPHEMINTTKTKIAGALTSITLGPLADQELDDDTGRMQLSVLGKDLRTGTRYEVVERDSINQRHRLLGNARDVSLRETLGEVMQALEVLMGEGREWVTSAELGGVLAMRADTVRKKVLAIQRNAQKQATVKGLADGRVFWKGRVLMTGSKGYRLGN